MTSNVCLEVSVLVSGVVLLSVEASLMVLARLMVSPLPLGGS